MVALRCGLRLGPFVAGYAGMTNAVGDLLQPDLDPSAVYPVFLGGCGRVLFDRLARFSSRAANGLSIRLHLIREC